MEETIKEIIAGLIVILIQVIICEFVNIWPPLYIAVIPLFIIMLPGNVNDSFLLIIAFCVGLAVDTFSDGLIGLNATACTAMAFFKPMLVKGVAKYESFAGATIHLDSRHIGFSRYLLFILICYSIFFAVYVLLDGIGSGTALFFLLRFVLNVTANVIIAMALERIFLSRIM